MCVSTTSIICCDTHSLIVTLTVKLLITVILNTLVTLQVTCVEYIVIALRLSIGGLGNQMDTHLFDHMTEHNSDHDSMLITWYSSGGINLNQTFLTWYQPNADFDRNTDNASTMNWHNYLNSLEQPTLFLNDIDDYQLISDPNVVVNRKSSLNKHSLRRALKRKLRMMDKSQNKAKHEYSNSNRAETMQNTSNNKKIKFLGYASSICYSSDRSISKNIDFNKCDNVYSQPIDVNNDNTPVYVRDFGRLPKLSLSKISNQLFNINTQQSESLSPGRAC